MFLSDEPLEHDEGHADNLNRNWRNNYILTCILKKNLNLSLQLTNFIRVLRGCSFSKEQIIFEHGSRFQIQESQTSFYIKEISENP